jgi:hypothetical protein
MINQTYQLFVSPATTVETLSQAYFPCGLRAAAFAPSHFVFVGGWTPRNRRTQTAPDYTLSLRGKTLRSAFSPGCSGYDARS